ncbi:MAG TPA: DUF3048 domain-containing protein [Patescibacteria group bacterium]
MDTKKRVIVALVAVIIVVGGYFLIKKRGPVKQININNVSQNQGPLNQGDISPISGLPCDNWNKRAVAVMQPSDLQARPAAGFSEADMVVEMPAYTSSVTRLMGVYLCNLPKEIGAIRSSRHDYIALAAGLDAVFVHWGGSHFALDLLKNKIIDNIECLTYEGKYCFRWTRTGIMRIEDTGHVTSASVLQAMKDLGYRTEGKFSGYSHQAEVPIEERPNGGHLRAAFANPYDVTYDYDKESNSYFRTWNETADTDRNNGQRIAPKNVVVIFAQSDQITTSQNYIGQGLQDPWKNVEEIKKTGIESISGRYNNVQIGDPWYDSQDSGEAHYYFNGQEYSGTWKKDRSRLDSKLTFYDNSGKEVMFVPGQIWVEILEPGQNLKWTPGA